MTAKHIYNIVLEIRGKQISHELIQTGEKGAKSEKKQIKQKLLTWSTYSVFLLTKIKRTFSNIFELV
jgi:hypothetical protein